MAHNHYQCQRHDQYSTFTGERKSRPFHEERETANSRCGIVTVDLTRSTLHIVNWSGIFNNFKVEVWPPTEEEEEEDHIRLSWGKHIQKTNSMVCFTILNIKQKRRLYMYTVSQ